MYPAELQIKDATESNTSASYLNLLLSIRRDGQLCTPLYDKQSDFNFKISNFPFLRRKNSSSLDYGGFISQLIRYARDFSSYECFILRVARLSCKLFGQGYIWERLKSSFRKYGRYRDLIKRSLSLPNVTRHSGTIYIDTLYWSDIYLIVTLLPNSTLLQTLTSLPKCERFQ